MGDVLSGGGEGQRLGERWAALPRKVRRVTLAATALVLLAVATGFALTTRPDAAPRGTQRVPYPVHSTRITFVRVLDVDARKRTFAVEMRATTADPVLIERIGQDYATLDLVLRPSRPVKVEPGRPKALLLRVRVVSCLGLPLRARLPYLEVTLRNARATQVLSFIPGDHYARSLTRVFRTVCGPSRGPSTGTP
ncbi:hypothetical protein [Streptomyces iconiensis]|uniref:Tat pathway signal sequence domain protein n=1 Tax=Streptomyces iconiensis TaxID=1384038 RepID=A0ABT6ZVU4_9ACTN|nr:hypothetical protein [Streptomyces iconiensis]MDJ1133193.1 hypothetical protein [Streptomyces iconiensis]